MNSWTVIVGMTNAGENVGYVLDQNVNFMKSSRPSPEVGAHQGERTYHEKSNGLMKYASYEWPIVG